MSVMSTHAMNTLACNVNHVSHTVYIPIGEECISVHGSLLHHTQLVPTSSLSIMS